MERLIGLAQKTGGKLIVHNPLEDHDVVILDVDEYEKLVLGENDYELFRPDVREMSEGELLDQINRDIATWRANKDQEEKWEQEIALGDELEDEMSFDPFAEQDFHLPEWHEEPPQSKVEEKPKQPSNWHSVSDLIEDRFSQPDEIKIDEIPNLSEPQKVPFKPVGVDAAWQEEPLASDEPVFYEEPV